MQRHLDEATALSTMLPATLSALRDGAITMQHARVIVEQTSDLGRDDREACAKLDELLAEFSTSNTAATVRRKARHLREEVMAETLAERQRVARAKRLVEFEAAADGMAWLHAFLPADDAALIFDRLDRVAASEPRGARAHRPVQRQRSRRRDAGPCTPAPIDSATNSARPTRSVPTRPATCCSTDPSTLSRPLPTRSHEFVRACTLRFR